MNKLSLLASFTIRWYILFRFPPSKIFEKISVTILFLSFFSLSNWIAPMLVARWSFLRLFSRKGNLREINRRNQPQITLASIWKLGRIQETTFRARPSPIWVSILKVGSGITITPPAKSYFWEPPILLLLTRLRLPKNKFSSTKLSVWINEIFTIFFVIKETKKYDVLVMV